MTAQPTAAAHSVTVLLCAAPKSVSFIRRTAVWAPHETPASNTPSAIISYLSTAMTILMRRCCRILRQKLTKRTPTSSRSVFKPTTTVIPRLFLLIRCRKTASLRWQIRRRFCSRFQTHGIASTPANYSWKPASAIPAASGMKTFARQPNCSPRRKALSAFRNRIITMSCVKIPSHATAMLTAIMKSLMHLTICSVGIGKTACTKPIGTSCAASPLTICFSRLPCAC